MKMTAVKRAAPLAVLGLAACEVLMMISPFAGFFYSTLHFRPFLGFLSTNSWTAWLDGFFLNHSAVTTSALLEGQREIGLYLFALGSWGFLVSAVQVYGKKLLRRGMAKGLLYRVCRHPQYLCLGVAGWGLLTIWPRFLLLGLWVSMLYLYAALARIEERHMAARFGEAYEEYARRRPAFLPFRPLRWIFAVPFSRIRPRALGWTASWIFALLAAFALAGALRTYARAHTAILRLPDRQTIVISTWPQPRRWVAHVFQIAAADPRVRERLRQQPAEPLVATILPPRYVMKGMYYKMPSTRAAGEAGTWASMRRSGRIVLRFLFPVKGFLRSNTFMGVDPDRGRAPLEVVFSAAHKPYKDSIELEECLDASVSLTPLVVARLDPRSLKVIDVQTPLPQNRWGPDVVMPLF